MVSAIRRGVMDLIGAARPSIADPFLPNKIRDGQVERIRECIGCNICVATDPFGIPIRCTQNPTMGEEWRRSWHPERIAVRRTEAAVMIVGGGPAGLEAARALGQRGHAVQLLDARNELGGRVLREALLPGLAPWRRVIDWRLTELALLPNVELFPGSPASASDLIDFGARHAMIATGAHWRRDGRGRTTGRPIEGHALPHVVTPDDLLDDLASNLWRLPEGPVLIYDDDHYVTGGALAELAAMRGHPVTLVTPAPLVSAWTQYTLEQERIEHRLRALGVQILTRLTLTRVDSDHATLASVIDQAEQQVTARSVVLLGDRAPNSDLASELQPALERGDLESLTVIGDADAPGLIAHAVFAGHRAARQFGEPLDRDVVEFRRVD
jgi:dimethylamine/trimethylamine dehydrogenase